ncbi:hypothetical protein CPC08DRAFT_764086 [Agrocybe pediades]|nr:hypothetical protein CPC08DRAFT_764086 [Agrocybe pediades]
MSTKTGVYGWRYISARYLHVQFLCDGKMEDMEKGHLYSPSVKFYLSSFPDKVPLTALANHEGPPFDMFSKFWTSSVGVVVLISGVVLALPGISSPEIIGLENDFIPLHRRQSESGVPLVPPAQCETSCDTITSVLSSDAGCKAETCCKSTFEKNYFNCFQCVAQAANLTDLSGPQFLVDTLFNECALAGFSLPKLTFPGQNTNRVLSSVVSHAPTPVATAVTPTMPTVSGSAPANTDTGASSIIPTVSLSLPTPSHSILTPSSAIISTDSASSASGTLSQVTITSLSGSSSAASATNTSPGGSASGTSGAASPSNTPAWGVKTTSHSSGAATLALLLGLILPRLL